MIIASSSVPMSLRAPMTSFHKNAPGVLHLGRSCEFVLEQAHTFVFDVVPIIQSSVFVVCSFWAALDGSKWLSSVRFVALVLVDALSSWHTMPL